MKRRSFLTFLAAAGAAITTPVVWAYRKFWPVTVTNSAGVELGGYDTIQAAIDALPDVVTEPIYINLAAGKYKAPDGLFNARFQASGVVHVTGETDGPLPLLKDHKGRKQEWADEVARRIKTTLV